MAQIMTNAEMQHDEIEALRSIYMDDFQEYESKPGAWNRVLERSFGIRLRASAAEDTDISLNLSVSLPITYPKTAPTLALEFGEGVRSKTKQAALELINERPKTLLGAEMIFDIGTLLQDVLDQAALATDAIALDQERAAQLAVKEQLAHEALSKKTEEETVDHENRLKDDHMTMSITMEQAQLRAEKRKARWPDKQDKSEIEAHGGLRFDRTMLTRDFEGAIAEFNTIYRKVNYRQGPVTKVFKVHIFEPGVPLQREVEPHLLLKECRVQVAGNKQFIKDCMLDLEDRMEKVLRLKDDPNVLKPLGYTIKRSSGECKGDEGGDEWFVGILVKYAPKGSMRDLLETVTVISPETFRAWALQLLEGLQFLHRNRVPHSAIHLSNILLEKDETGNVVVKLSDAFSQHAMHIMRHGGPVTYTAACSTGWVAPELVHGTSIEALLSSDVWYLGICFLQMLFGHGIQNSQSSPRDLINSLKLSSSLHELTRKIFVDSDRRASAFDLLPAAFLRSDDPLFTSYCQPVSFAETTNDDSSIPDIARHRRSSARAPIVSRYRSDFVEAGRLGRGGFGEVVRARNKLDGRFYAVKKIKSRSASSLNDVLSEIIILSQLNHPYVVRYYNAWLEDEIASHADQTAQSISVEASSGTESDDDVLVAEAPSGLDFMSQSGPDVDIIFESDSEKAADFEEGSENSDQLHEQDTRNTNTHQSEEGSDESDHDRYKGSLHKPRSNGAKRQQDHSKTVLYIQMEYCERKTLRDLINANIHEDNVESWRIFRQILEGLAHVHALSIVHRDLKPENIFIDAESDVRIGDFGLARHGHYQPQSKLTNMEEAYTVFTKSVGTTFYVAPEVRSAGKGIYDEKADMYSLGIIFFEMCVPMMTAMERADILGRLRGKEHALPQIFEHPEKSTQGEIIYSLIDHDPTNRPGSSQLLASEQIPGEVRNDKVGREVLRYIHEGSYRKQLVAGLFLKPDELQASTIKPGDSMQLRSATVDCGNPDDDKDYYPRLRPQELTFDMKDRSNSADDLLLRNSVKDQITSIFRRHGAVPVEGPALLPFSSHYLRKYDHVVKLLSSNDDFLQLPFDNTLPNARLLAKAARSPRKTYCFCHAFREVKNGGAPRRIGEADFDIVSYNSRDLGLREAEVIKVVDEIVDSFPSMASLPVCYHINHSMLFNAILGFCKIHPSQWALVKDLLGTLQAGQTNWSKIRDTLRTPAIGVTATSIEELMRFDFREIYDKAVARLRGLLSSKSVETLESSFTHMEALTTYLKHYKVSRKVFLSPLSSINESFYRGHLFFQCIFDTPKREVFAAGGRYDQLIKSQIPGYQPKSIHDPRAVGFSFNWERLCTSMMRYLKANVKAKSKKRIDAEAPIFRTPRRCEVLVDSSDREVLHSTGIDIIQGLWANDISAELVIDTEADETNSVYYPSAESKYYHSWIVYVKQDGNLKVRNVDRKEECEIRSASELYVWFRNELRERDRSDGRPSITRLPRSSSHQDSGPSAGELDVRIITSSTKGKKFNRKNVIEQANAVVKETVHGFLDSPVVAVEIKDDTFERIRETRLSDLESWKKLIQHTPADDRAYLRNLQSCLQDTVTERPGNRRAFIYNFRSKSCIYYDLE